MAPELVTKSSLEPGASFGRDDMFQASRSSLARTCILGVLRGSLDTGSLACSGLPTLTAGRGSGWQRGHLSCVRGNYLLRWLLWWRNWIWGQQGRFLVHAPL